MDGKDLGAIFTMTFKSFDSGDTSNTEEKSQIIPQKDTRFSLGLHDSLIIDNVFLNRQLLIKFLDQNPELKILEAENGKVATKKWPII
ncbi:MAG: hypothetical protein IPG24_08560 [Leptospiraceae bacterium]|nr:hypothetical protein [Leptospiraceae bacterium]